MEAVASPSQQRWQKRILALCWVSYALSYLCRTKLSIALPEMTAQLHWSAAGKAPLPFGWHCVCSARLPLLWVRAAAQSQRNCPCTAKNPVLPLRQNGVLAVLFRFKGRHSDNPVSAIGKRLHFNK